MKIGTNFFEQNLKIFSRKIYFWKTSLGLLISIYEAPILAKIKAKGKTERTFLVANKKSGSLHTRKKPDWEGSSLQLATDETNRKGRTDDD